MQSWIPAFLTLKILVRLNYIILLLFISIVTKKRDRCLSQKKFHRHLNENAPGRRSIFVVRTMLSIFRPLKGRNTPVRVLRFMRPQKRPHEGGQCLET